MNKKGLAVGILLLFIVTSVSPMVIGYKSGEVIVESDVLLENLNYDSYHVSEIINNDFKKTNLFGSEPVIYSGLISKPFTSEPIKTINSGLMDSAWPMFSQNVRHTGQSPYSPVEFPIEKWRYNVISGGYGSPVIDHDGTIYFGGSDFHDINPNGTLKWTEFLYGAAYSSPVINEDGLIFVGTAHGIANYLYGIRPNGSIKWQQSYGSIFSSPVIGTDGTIYIGSANGDEGNIYAIYPNNGTMKWVFQANHVVYSSPAIGDDGTIYCGSHDGNLYALYPNNGTEKWRYHTDNWIRTSPCIADDGTIYMISLDDYLYSINPDGTLKWKIIIGGGTSPTIGGDGTIYCGYTKLHAVNPNSTIKWVFEPGPGRKIRGGTPCNDANGTIYFGTSIDDISGGEIIAVNSDGTERWRKLISNDYVEAAPCIADDGTLYVVSPGYYGELGSACYLHAFGTLEGNLPPEMQTIEGTIEGKINYPYKYTFYADDPDNNPVAYFVDWGDGQTEDWTMDYEPGVTIYFWHEWSEKGDYTIRVKARDSVGEASDWMYLEVTMPVNQQNFSFPLLQRLLELFPNMFPILRNLLEL